MTRPLNGRVDRLEELRGVSPGPWRAQLALLTRDYEERFPLPIAGWSEALCDEFLLYQASNEARHFGDLRQRGKKPAERAADAAAQAEVAAMTAEELSTYLAGEDR